ncbi:Transcription initiation factor TFIID subunit 6 [Echinococcus granulosus]|uniref:Transcription initiation factor tfiid subunit 6 n=1 Tax=Echinococcus granulosus TaxID=6210 RepID=A0A068WQ93_ECHGR|nr:Transcription initiation factor TFIID subunit 6 [Echinococcus granulosus]CDS19795.1 transcription initiation factor tfiid subunit 6 [Echinococcus granulosus]
MYSEERKKLNRLSRKASNTCGTKKRLLNSRLAGKSSLKGQKHPNSNGVHLSRSTTSRHLDFPLEFFKSCAEINAVSPFSGEGISVLQKHLYQITTALVQNAVRNMEQNRRGTPHISDIDSAALAMGMDIPYGAATGELIPVRTSGRNAAPGVGGKMILIRKDKEVDIKTLLRRQPTPVVYDISLVVHWLAIDGVQPASPQNPPPEFLRRMTMLSGTQTPKAICTALNPTLKIDDTQQPSVDAKTDKNKAGDDRASHPRVMQALHVERRPQEVSQELMLYFRELTEACVGANEIRRRDALENATLDTGLQPLVPYLVTFIAEGIRLNAINSNLAILIYLVRLTKALVDNPNVSLKAYLQSLVPGIITCSLCRQVCAKPITDNHWALRDFAAKQLVAICNKYNTSCNGLYSRITRELYRVLSTWIEGKSAATSDHFSTSTSSAATTSAATDNTDHSSSTTPTDPTRKEITGVPRVSLGMAVDSLNTLYGTLTCITEFGGNCLRMLVFPRLPALCRRLTRMTTASASNTPQSTASVSNPAEMVVVMDQEGFQQTFNASSATTLLSNAEMRSLDSLKKLMNTRFVGLLAEWRVRQNLPVTPEAYKADYGVMASCLFASAAQADPPRPHATPAGALIVTKPQPPLNVSR